MTTTEYQHAYRVPPQRIAAALLTARLAAQQKHIAADEYRTAVAAAHRCGATYAELAAVLGITRQAVRQYTLTTGRN